MPVVSKRAICSAPHPCPPMHILLLNQFFWPDEAATSQLLTDVARALAAAGCQVTAICGRSRYAGGNGAAPPAVKILRTPESPFSRTKTGRLISYASFLIGVAWHGARAAKPDVILSLTTPPGLAVMGALLARVRGARHYIWEMDVYPDVAEALGALRAGGWVAKALGKVFDAARARADGVIALGECMAARIEARGVPRQKISVAENWADGGAIRPRPFPADGKLTLLYSGHL